MAYKRYVELFFDGLVEVPIGAVIGVTIAAFVIALNGLPAGSQSVAVLLEFSALTFLISLVINFVKGMVASFEAMASVGGMITGIVLFSDAISSISPDAVTAVVAYIIAAVVGIVLGAYFHQGNRAY